METGFSTWSSPASSSKTECPFLARLALVYYKHFSFAPQRQHLRKWSASSTRSYDHIFKLLRRTNGRLDSKETKGQEASVCFHCR